MYNIYSILCYCMCEFRWMKQILFDIFVKSIICKLQKQILRFSFQGCQSCLLKVVSYTVLFKKSVLFFERWQKFKLFWFFVLACVLEKNKKCLNARWVFALLPTLSIWFCGGFETQIFQFTPMFIYC